MSQGAFAKGRKSHNSWDISELKSFSVCFYMRKQLLLSARLSHRYSVCPFVCLSVCHTGGSVNNGANWDHQIFTVGCLEDTH